MNNMGRLLNIQIWGESHGPAVGAVLDGCPAGVPLALADFVHDLARRRAGAFGTSARKETDAVKLYSGVFRGKTTGAPICLCIENKDIDSSWYEKHERLPRPGHADWVGNKKYAGNHDFRGGGHFSGRLTAPLVALGVIAKKIIAEAQITTQLVSIGKAQDETAMRLEVQNALDAGDSVGAVIECIVDGLSYGLGEPFFDSVEACLAHAMFSIPGIKGVEFGVGFEAGQMRGSVYNDELLDASGQTASNHCGGIQGGITNSNPMVFRVAVRPSASIARMQTTVHLDRNEKQSISVGGRHDACFALRVPVVVEALTALVLADLSLCAKKVEIKGNGYDHD